MKNNMKLFIQFLLITLIISGCSKEEITTPATEGDFILDASELTLFGTMFIVVTNQEGVVVFDTISNNYNGIYRIDIEPGDELDVTYGIEFDKNFNIVTYRNIPSGFKLDLSTFNCDDLPLSGLTYVPAEIVIEGLAAYDFLHVPLGSKEIIADSMNNRLVVSGFYKTNEDLIVTVLPKGQSEHKSILIKSEDFITQSNGDWHRTVRMDHFSSSVINEINLNVEENWIQEVVVTDGSGTTTNVFNWSSYEDYQNGNIIRSFVPENLDFNNVRFSLSNGHLYNGYAIQKTFSQFPDQIELDDMLIEIYHADQHGYDLQLDDDHDFSVATMYYLFDSVLSQWIIYSTDDNLSTFDLPDIPTSFLNQTDILKTQIETPHAFKVELFRVGDPILGDHGEGLEIVNDLLCFEYDAYRKGFLF